MGTCYYSCNGSVSIIIEIKYSILVMRKLEEQKLDQLSPFEVKNTLIKLAKKRHDYAMINAGRGNPNWVATKSREAFFQLGMFALEEANRTFKEMDGFGGQAEAEGISHRFENYLEYNKDSVGLQYLKKMFDFAVKEYNLVPDELMVEWVDGILGDNYPVPDRMLVNAEKIVHEYIIQEMSNGSIPPAGKFDLFAVEGGTAAMVYIFNTLKSNMFLNPGDTIALGAPIFTPYIEMPELKDYNLKKVEVVADENNSWQIPDSELDKLKDPKVKAFFLVNPSNPPSVKMSDETLDKVAEIAKQRKDLILLTDDVYGTFTDEFTSLAMKAPENTILVYSFSKYFGATGWRLGVIALHQDNIFDKALASYPEKEKKTLFERYSSIALDPASVKMIDRFVADSRAVALNHTSGLSTPQQIQMVMFSLSALMDTENNYKKIAKGIVRNRYNKLIEDVGIEPLVSPNDPHGAFYYIEIDVLRLAESKYGKDFAIWVSENYNPLDPVIRLAEEKAIVAMPGGGFDAPEWTLRLSLANSFSDDFEKVKILGLEILEEYYSEYQDRG